MIKIRRLIMSNLATFSSTMLYIAFGFYSIATIIFGITIKDKNTKKKKDIAGRMAITLTIIGRIAHLGYVIPRWIAGGHAPVGNMVELMALLGWSSVLAFIMIYFIYRLHVV